MARFGVQPRFRVRIAATELSSEENAVCGGWLVRPGFCVGCCMVVIA